MSQLFLGILLALVHFFAPAAGGVAPHAAPEPQAGYTHTQKGKSSGGEKALPSPAPKAAHPLAIDVRGAALGSVAAQMGAASESSLRASAELADERVTLYAPRTDVEEFRDAVATLLGHRWRSIGMSAAGAEQPRWVLERDPGFTARRTALQQRQRARFLRRVLETANAIAGGREDETLEQVKATFQKRHPEFDADMLKELNAGFLRQSLVALPLAASLQAQLVRSGAVSIPFYLLSPAHQQLLAGFAQSGALRGALGLTPGPGDVTLPNSRVTYRLLYGDRWTDDVLWMQVGAPGSWATAILPSILFREEDGSDLYPRVKERPNDPDVWRRTPGRFDLSGKSWERILADLSAAMGLKIAADSTLRPSVFAPKPPAEAVAGIPLRMALDRLTQNRGLFWWKEGDWYYIRSRTWMEENRVAVPDRLLSGWARDVRSAGHLTEADLDQLGNLSEEQLMTLNLMARAPREAGPHLAAFDPNNAALAATSELMVRALPPVVREQAFTAAGLPTLWMPPFQQSFYNAIAQEEGYLLLPEEANDWGFAVEQVWNTTAPNQPVVGRLRWRWSFGPGLEEIAEINIKMGESRPTTDSRH